jgi:hypothetical protein
LAWRARGGQGCSTEELEDQKHESCDDKDGEQREQHRDEISNVLHARILSRNAGLPKFPKRNLAGTGRESDAL